MYYHGLSNSYIINYGCDYHTFTNLAESEENLKAVLVLEGWMLLPNERKQNSANRQKKKKKKDFSTMEHKEIIVVFEDNYWKLF